ncbi:type I restriction-modification methylase [Burkholderia pseudomallei]|uniref:type I restriction-modification system subunit M n=1 Tax=Burkholderia pseudomallei TaxID=28450 RepID=UPI000977A649|nr:class I SAM-dependent DNA methyltransferase [Burkholderia pseudomallei]MVZ88434.1 N-6 DNA methylase [Burkholderia pseudomallei]MWA22142.1 N-6 DNA methylase [Burkholderia pseudomallei]MWA25964.1 N-6 DNA methylase [Burkholderia pseudomallei]OMS02945.1 DNA methylase [Burkholderia pseudomallei]OMS39681.1 DNA methylase [Burkholderia pseudomallei]
MDHSVHNKIVSFIWSIADDCLRDVFVRGKYRDVILPMFVLRRLDCLLEPSKEAVLEEVRFQREDAEMADLDPHGLREASGYVFYNTSRFTLKSLLGNPSQLEANLKNYLDGFSDNVKEIVEKFDLRNQIRKMVQSDVLHDVIEKFVSDEINLSPNDRKGPDGRTQPGLSNLGMGYVFEELIRKFNEENNEEAGEHFTPREVIKLMTNLVFIPVKDLLPNPLTIYDPACGSGGMLTESQDFITDPEGGIKAKVGVFLYGKEVNPETYAICKSDMMIKGNDPENIKFGSTLATDDFSGTRFDFMLTNPPYGKSWKADQKSIVDGKDVIDHRFQVNLSDYIGQECDFYAAIPRSSDGQLLFMMEMVNKMKRRSHSPMGSRIASVHNGSALFTGDAGSGESNIRRHIIESDYLEAIIQLPNNLFYNTGITTYVWILSNNKAEKRKGKVQLIDASNLYQKLRKNLGEKNCEFTDDHIHQITQLYVDMPNDGISKVFNNRDFGYYKVTVERPLRLAAQFGPDRIATLRFTPGMQDIMEWVYGKYGDEVYTDLKSHTEAIETHLEREEIALSPKNRKELLSEAIWREQRDIMQVAQQLAEKIGAGEFLDFNRFEGIVDAALKVLGLKLAAPARKQILNAVSWRDERAEKVIKKVHKLNAAKLGDLLLQLGTTHDKLGDYGYMATPSGDYIEYEPDSELRDTENVPLALDTSPSASSVIHAYFIHEVRPHVDDAWIAIDKTVIGYEISFNKYFYQHKPLRSLEEVTEEILALEAETDGLLKQLVSFVSEATQ